MCFVFWAQRFKNCANFNVKKERGGGGGPGPDRKVGRSITVSDQPQKFPDPTGSRTDPIPDPTGSRIHNLGWCVPVPEVVSIISDSRLRLEMLSSIRRLYSLPACLNSHTAVSTFLRWSKDKSRMWTLIFCVADLGLFIPDPNFFHPGSEVQGQKDSRIPDSDPHLHQRIYPKIVSKLSEIWSRMFIPDPDFVFFTHSGSWI